MRALGQAGDTPCSSESGHGIGATLHGLAGHLTVGAVTLNGGVYHAVIGGM
jgi:hypothetical protein